jgi:hypothetical protein
VEAGPVRTVFATAPVPTTHSTVRLVVEVYSAVRRLDVRVALTGWDSAFGPGGGQPRRVSTAASPGGLRNVSYAVPFGVVRVGTDKYTSAAGGAFRDLWLTDPPATLQPFERAWAMRPREVGDWVRAEVAAGVGVTVSSSVGVFDWVDPTGAYPASQPVLAPEMLVHTDSNRSPFLPEPGDHGFLFSLTATRPGWQAGWRAGVQPNNLLRSVVTTVPAAGVGRAAAAAGLQGQWELVRCRCCTASCRPLTHLVLRQRCGSPLSRRRTATRRAAWWCASSASAQASSRT